ncbi:MAG: hypothetical protein KJO62_04365 [Gammaproteobacteria bacterium]|nr:hypothetical protein [Gammaproteobacteria bacterium]
MNTRRFLHELMHNDRKRLAHFSCSAVIFFVSLAMLYWVDKELPPSMQQELAALGFTVLAGIAFFWAMAMQLVYILSRLSK